MSVASAQFGKTISTENSPGLAKRLSLGLIVLGALARVLSYFCSVNSGGDAGAHVELAAKWLQHPTWKFVFEVYPPGHFWLIGLCTLLFHNVITAGRMLSLILGIASLFPLWKLARLLYGEWAGMLSLAVFSLYTLHIAYSTTSSAEVSYLFFFLVGAYFFFRFLNEESRKLSLLAFSGISLSISESVRFEAWVLFAGMFLVLAVVLRTGASRVSWGQWCRALVVFGATAGAWPVFMMVYCWRTFGDPMYLVTANRSRVVEYLAASGVSHLYQLALMPSALVIALSPFAIAGAIYGFVLSFSSRLKASFAALTAFFAAVQAYQLWNGGLLATARYSITLGTLLAVISGLGSQAIVEKLFANRKELAYSGLLGLLLLNALAVLVASEVQNPFSERLASVSPRLRYQKRVRDVGNYLRHHLRPEDAIIIDDYNVESNVLAEAAGLPPASGDRVYLASKKIAGSPLQYIQSEHPRFMVYAEQGTLRKSLQLPSGCDGTQVLYGIQFHCTFSGQIYRVYELDYP